MELIYFIIAVLLMIVTAAIVSLFVWASFTILPNETFSEDDDIEKP